MPPDAWPPTSPAGPAPVRGDARRVRARTLPRASARRDRLARLLALVRERERDFVAAIDRDFGHRSSHETRLAELYIVAAAARHALANVRRWMRPRRVATPMHLLPGRARIVPQPLGVAGIISPWNYPVQLALAPAIGALAAGNRVMLKPSELTPATSALLAERSRSVSRRTSSPSSSATPTPAPSSRGCRSTTCSSPARPRSAASSRWRRPENLTPVTLELGGKSPAIVDASADLAVVAPRIAVGKLLNAGQTCIAPDYALVPERRVDEFVAAVTRAVRALYPDPLAGDDYTSIVNERHYDRLVALIEDARAKGAKVVTIPDGAAPDPATRRIPPTLLVGATDAMPVMREEIFGPILPVESYAKLDDAIAAVTRRPRPLAFYLFAEDRAVRERLLRETIAGGVTVNDTLWHFAHEDLPFGGVGASGIGAYHGEAGFRHVQPHEERVLAAPARGGEAPLPALWLDVREGAAAAEAAVGLKPDPQAQRRVGRPSGRRSSSHLDGKASG